MRFLEMLRSRAKSNRPRSFLILARSGNGKTELGARFQSKHPPTQRLNEKYIRYPVLRIVLPSAPTVGRFHTKILEEYGQESGEGQRNDEKQTRARGLMRDTGVRMLIIDEVQQVLDATTKKQKDQVLNEIKNLSTEMGIHVVGLGMPETESIFEQAKDDQLASRFMVDGLPKWTLEKKTGEDEHGGKEEYLQLLNSFEDFLPLRKPSNLVQDHLARKILDMGDARIGDIDEAISLAAVKAIDSEEERITSKVLDDCDWHKIAKRRKKARRAA